MSTTVKIVKRVDLGHGAIAVTLRPNDDEAHDSAHTLYIKADMARADIEGWLAECKRKVADLYDAQRAAHDHLASLE